MLRDQGRLWALGCNPVWVLALGEKAQQGADGGAVCCSWRAWEGCCKNDPKGKLSFASCAPQESLSPINLDDGE